MVHQNKTDGQSNHADTIPEYQTLDLDRMAKLVADGEISFPTQLSPDGRDRLMVKVSRLRRARFVRYIARSIALDIHRSSEP